MGNNEWLLIVFLLVGLAGTIIPLIPGMGLIFLALCVYSFFHDWQVFSFWYLAAIGLLALLSFGVDYLASAVGAKKFGASKMGFWGAAAGGVIGMIFLNFFGLILGALLGIIIAELYQKKTIQQSLTAATGVLAGTVVGMVIQFILALLVVIVSIVKLV